VAIENHTAQIFDRGGKQMKFDLKGVSKIKWTRERDEMSEASVDIPIKEVDRQGDNLASIDPGRHELVIFRNEQRVWEGPCNIPKQERDKFSITANDTLHYYNRTAMRAGYSSAGTAVEFVARRIERIARAELARKEAMGYNLLSFLTAYTQTGDARTTTTTAPYQSTVYGHLETLAARAGIDYTMIGRALHIWDTSRGRMGTTPIATQADFLSDVTVARYGAELATHSYATDGQGVAGMAGGNDPYYGEVELIATAYDEEIDEVRPTLAELTEQAARNLRGRNPTPMTIKVPENSSINPKGVLGNMDYWVPGIYIPLRGKIGSFEVNQLQKLQKLTVTETDKGETVQMSLYPASTQDA